MLRQLSGKAGRDGGPRGCRCPEGRCRCAALRGDTGRSFHFQHEPSGALRRPGEHPFSRRLLHPDEGDTGAPPPFPLRWTERFVQAFSIAMSAVCRQREPLNGTFRPGPFRPERGQRDASDWRSAQRAGPGGRNVPSARMGGARENRDSSGAGRAPPEPAVPGNAPPGRARATRSRPFRLPARSQLRPGCAPARRQGSATVPTMARLKPSDVSASVVCECGPSYMPASCRRPSARSAR